LCDGENPVTVTSIISYLGEGLLSARPTNPGVPADTVALYYATDVPQLYVWNGSAWASATAGRSGQAFDYTLSWGAGAVAANGTIVLEGNMQSAAHILGANWQNGAGGGSITGDFEINTTPITGLSAVVNNGTSSASASAANAMSPGDLLRVVLSAASGAIADGGFFNVHGTYD
jgi:hypothetical protein